MKYKKIPKAVQTAAVFITGILVGGATVLGAYAAPTTKLSTDRITLTDTTISSDGETTGSTIDSSTSQTATDTVNTAAQDSNAISQTPDYSIEYEDGTFYILTGDATEADKPSSAVTNGYHHLVLVRKDEYHSFGSWTVSEMKNLVRHITTQCRTALKNGRMTQEDVDIVIAASTEIQEAYRSGDDIQEIYRPGDNDSVADDSGTGDSVTLYNYTQAAYYQAPYIIEIGYNLTSESLSKYSSTLITLSDQRTLPVFFSAKSEKYISDATAISAVTALIERMAPNAAKSTRPLEAPFIVSMEYAGKPNMDSLAEKYYEEEMLTYFGAIFLELDDKTQQEYLDRMFEDGNISFFACCIGMFERSDMPDTQREKNIVDHYTLKAYEEDKVNFFAFLSGMLDEESRKSWLERCKKDGRADYYYILSDEDEDIFDDTDFMDDTDYFDEWNELEDAFSSYQDLNDYLEEMGLLDEYNQNDIITIKDAYYYHNARVRLLMDVRSDGSFENFNYNERGTVDLRLVRDKNNDIVRVEYLSTEEAAEIIQDINDDSIPDDTDYFRSSSAPNILDLTRITKQDVSTALQNVLDSCDSGKWYVITENDCQYIYYNGLPHTYAYEPHIDGSETGDLITVAITDINMDSRHLHHREAVSDYVLLLFSYAPGATDKDYNLTLTYNQAPVTYDTISVASGTARSIADLYPDTPQSP